MAVPNSEAVQWLPSGSTSADSRSGRIGPISLGAKQTGERSARNPHAAFDEAGAGNVARPRWCDTRNTKERDNREHKLRPKPARQSPTLPMRGVWKRSHGRATKAPPDERGGKPICSTYSRRATLRLYRFATLNGCVSASGRKAFVDKFRRTAQHIFHNRIDLGALTGRRLAEEK